MHGKGIKIFIVGVFTTNEGDCYDGLFANDKKEGKGIYTYSNGDKYEGIWKNDVRDGKGN